MAHEAVRTGAIDLYPEYTGTGLNAVMKAQGVTETDPGKVHEMVRAYYEKEFKLTWLKPSGINNGYAIIVRPETAREMNLKTLSDLAKVAPKLKLGAGPEFADRRDGIKGMKEVYGIEFGEFRQFAALRLRYDALAQKQIDVANGFATDWQIAAEKFAALDDDKGLFPPYYLAAVVRLEVAANPKIVEAIERVGAVIDNVDDAGAEPPGRGRQEGAAPGRGGVPEGEGHRSLTAATASPVAEAPTAGAKRRRSADPPGTSEGEPAVAVGGRIAIGDVVAVARGASGRPRPRGARPARSGARDRRPARASGRCGLWPDHRPRRRRRYAAAGRRDGELPASRRGGPRRRRRRAARHATRSAPCCSSGSPASPAAPPGFRPASQRRCATCWTRGVHPLVRRTGTPRRGRSRVRWRKLFLPFVGAGEAECARQPDARPARRCGLPASPSRRSDRRTPSRF